MTRLQTIEFRKATEQGKIDGQKRIGMKRFENERLQSAYDSAYLIQVGRARCKKLLSVF